MQAKFVLAMFLCFSSVFPALSTELRHQPLLSGKAAVSLPIDLQPMSDEMKAVKYPSPNPPTEVFSNVRGTVNFTATSRPYTGDDPVWVLAAAIAARLNQAGKVREWRRMETRKVGDRDYSVLEFVGPALDTEIYNYIYMTKRGTELVIFSVNCSNGLHETWRSTFDEIIDSTRIVEP